MQNKKLSELFDLPVEESNLISSEQTTSTEIEDAKSALSSLEKIESALPQVRGLEMADAELDELGSLAVSSYRDLIDLGLQVDSRYSAEILSVGATMLGHAITVKTAKINKKLKTIELQLKKAQLDRKTSEHEQQIESTPLGSGKSLDRNELLKMFGSKNDEKNNSADK